MIGNWVPTSQRRIGNEVLSRQSFSEILRISEKGLNWTHKNLKWLPHIEGALLKFKIRSGSYSVLGASIQANKQAKKSQATVPIKRHSHEILWRTFFASISSIWAPDSLASSFSQKFSEIFKFKNLSPFYPTIQIRVSPIFASKRI
jgi:hypothetical protein